MHKEIQPIPQIPNCRTSLEKLDKEIQLKRYTTDEVTYLLQLVDSDCSNPISQTRAAVFAGVSALSNCMIHLEDFADEDSVSLEINSDYRQDVDKRLYAVYGVMEIYKNAFDVVVLDEIKRNMFMYLRTVYDKDVEVFSKESEESANARVYAWGILQEIGVRLKTSRADILDFRKDNRILKKENAAYGARNFSGVLASATGFLEYWEAEDLKQSN